MSTPLHAVETGSFLSDGSIVNLSLPAGYSKIELYNITDQGSAAANTNVMEAYGTSLMPAGAGVYFPKTSGAATLGTPVTLSSGGFTFVADSALVANGSYVALNTGTTVNNASPAVAATGTTTGLVAGSTVVRLKGTTGMLQVSGMDFTIGTIVGSTSFQLKYLDSTQANLSDATASAGSYMVINADSRFYPRSRNITKMASSGTSTVITLSVVHRFTVGQEVRLLIPNAWSPSGSGTGFPTLNGQQALITAISTTNNTITVNVDSSALGTFTWPTSAVAGAGYTFAQVVPIGEGATTVAGVVNPANLLDDATINQSYTGVQIGATVQTSGSSYQWIATKGLAV